MNISKYWMYLFKAVLVATFAINSTDAVSQNIADSEYLRVAPNFDTVSFTPVNVRDLGDGLIGLLSKKDRALFVFDTQTMSIVKSVGFVDVPLSVLHTESNGRYYVSLETGQIITLNENFEQATPFYKSANNIGTGLDTLGGFILAMGRGFDEYQSSISVISEGGELKSIFQGRYFGFYEGYSLKIFDRYRDILYSNRVRYMLDNDGTFGEAFETFEFTIQGDLNVAPDGSTLLMQNGFIYELPGSQLVGSLWHNSFDAQWQSDGSLLNVFDQTYDNTVEYEESLYVRPRTFVLQEWNSAPQLLKEISLNSLYVFLVETGGQTFVVREKNGRPHVFKWNVGSNDIDNDGIPDGDDSYPAERHDPNEVTTEPPLNVEGYRFSRNDIDELRWIGPDDAGLMGSVWIDSACFDRLEGPVVTGSWHDLIEVAFGGSPLENPCTMDLPPSMSAPVVGYRFFRTDIDELRWVGPDSNDVMGSVWLDRQCFNSLEGELVYGDWHDLVSLAPGENPQVTPCVDLPAVTENTAGIDEGFFFSRTDVSEYRWLSTDVNGEVGSTWVDPDCWRRLGAESVAGDWLALQKLAPGSEPVNNPCIDSTSKPMEQPEPSGLRFSRSDIFEFRWIGVDVNGVQGSEWIDQNCFNSLNAQITTGDWFDQIAIAPGGKPVSNPCRAD